MLGTLIFLGGLGSIVDSFLKPLYEDTILAWWSVRVPSRMANSGWERLYEYFQQNGGKAYTITVSWCCGRRCGPPEPSSPGRSQC
jgi:hypothetical protein